MRVSLLQVAASSLLAGSLAFAQNVAPRDNPSLEVAGKKVAIEYGQPALGDRSLGELMKDLPADGMWRAGSEQVTTLSTEGDIVIGAAEVPAGEYSLYVHCGKDGSRSLAVNKVLGQPLGKAWAQAPDALKEEPWPHFNYQEEIGSEEVARVPLAKASLDTKQDRFKIALEPAGDGATLAMSWGDESWTTTVKAAE
jgi:hypothetical protein